MKIDIIRKIAPWLAVVAILIVMVLQLHRQGRVGWCACGQYLPWAGDIWSSHNSQHFFDPYSFTHVLHGMIFCGLLVWLLPRLPLALLPVRLTPGILRIMSERSFTGGSFSISSAGSPLPPASP